MRIKKLKIREEKEKNNKIVDLNFIILIVLNVNRLKYVFYLL